MSHHERHTRFTKSSEQMSAGFEAVMDRLRDLNDSERRELLEQAERTLDHQQVYRWGREQLEEEKYESAAFWLQVAAHCQVVGAVQDLDGLTQGPALPAGSAADRVMHHPPTDHLPGTNAHLDHNDDVPGGQGERAQSEPPQAGRRAAQHPRPQTVTAHLNLLLLTNALQPSTEVLPALGLLLHTVRVTSAGETELTLTPGADVVLIDGRRDLPQVRSLCQRLGAARPRCPILLVVNEGCLAAVTADWGIDDVLLDTAGPAEVEARLRLARVRTPPRPATKPTGEPSTFSQLSIDAATYSAKLKGRVLDLTFKEFELLTYLAQHPGRVFTRAQLLQEVWGYDYFGDMRTVDVHVRRLRAKLGPEHESLIQTVRNVGYRLVIPESESSGQAAERDTTNPPTERDVCLNAESLMNAERRLDAPVW
ncbi:hypothetical protein GCM10010271_65110 [Streptomyces kurssanovii]|nr:hypothetical protein GCM10010271_65110 [Streptomyces kurssanovii]